MEGNEVKISEWIEKFKRGEFSAPDRSTQIKAGWYDWFCRDTSLRNKTYRMGNIVKQIKNEKFTNNCYVFFKNNCPMFGPLFDSFKIVPIKDDGDARVLYSISISDKRLENTYAIYGRENDFEKPLFTTDYVKELVKYINNL